MLNVIGPGVALDPEILLEEINGLRQRGIEVGENLLISNRAHLVMPYHKKQDRLGETRLGASRKIGTTAKGIGPCYAEKMLRSTALRFGDLFDAPVLRSRLREIVADRNAVFATLYNDNEPLDADAIAETFINYGQQLARHRADTTKVLHAALESNKQILVEGAQGALLDIDHGTFPFVTSSSCLPGGIAPGSGLPPAAIRTYLGVIKAYSTRVGSGPFPTELHDDTGEAIRRKGREFGTTTGRPRRCGWFDACAARYSVALGGVTQLAIMHLDTLSGFKELNICTGYRLGGAEQDFFSPDWEFLINAEPIYETLPGWPEGGANVKRHDDLPAEAKAYLNRIEQLLRKPITIISVGPERSATLFKA